MRVFTGIHGDRQFDTVAKAALIEEQLRAQGLGDFIEMAKPMTASDATKYHTREYITALETGKPSWLASSSGLKWNGFYRNAIFQMAGAMMEATQYALISGKPAFALTAGAHHARPHKGMGFCALNSVAMAALYAARSTDRQVFVLDVDAHGGGGTQMFFDQEHNERIFHIDVTTSPFDTHNQMLAESPNVISVQVPEFVRGAHTYFDTLNMALRDASYHFMPQDGDILIVNAGCDVHEQSAIGGYYGMNTEMIAMRESIINNWAAHHGLVVVGLLAGGYSDEQFTMEQLASVHVASICALMGVQ